MKRLVICDFVEPELNMFRDMCNFTDEEREFFEYRAKNESIEVIAEKMHISVGKANKLSRKVKDKILKIL
jgi:hypothetical protein